MTPLEITNGPIKMDALTQYVDVSISTPVVVGFLAIVGIIIIMTTLSAFWLFGNKLKKTNDKNIANIAKRSFAESNEFIRLSGAVCDYGRRVDAVEVNLKHSNELNVIKWMQLTDTLIDLKETVKNLDEKITKVIFIK